MEWKAHGGKSGAEQYVAKPPLLLYREGFDARFSDWKPLILGNTSLRGETSQFLKQGSGRMNLRRKCVCDTVYMCVRLAKCICESGERVD